MTFAASAKGNRKLLIHLFWNCTVTSLFWQAFKEWLPSSTEAPPVLDLTLPLVIGLKPQLLENKYHYFSILDL